MHTWETYQRLTWLYEITRIPTSWKRGDKWEQICYPLPLSLSKKYSTCRDITDYYLFPISTRTVSASKFQHYFNILFLDSEMPVLGKTNIQLNWVMSFVLELSLNICKWNKSIFLPFALFSLFFPFYASLLYMYIVSLLGQTVNSGAIPNTISWEYDSLNKMGLTSE